MGPLPKLLTTDEVCASLNVSRQWVKNHLADGDLCRFKVGKHNRFLLSDVQDCISRHNNGRTLPLLDDDDDFIEDD